jgi:hypothetical protein
MISREVQLFLRKQKQIKLFPANDTLGEGFLKVVFGRGITFR